ncbi:MAG: hypothetical protein A3K09_03020 [Nitrospinae bacterium RIFCSPLOWO2_12_FULL_47_7]|nr:MAG: hypothetical protein A3K09_03020 [Nitrospinae bacterium RIFCSPLOWO2_12_FULL_47_7]
MRKIKVALFFILVICAMAFLTTPPPASAEPDGGDIIFKETGKLPPALFSHKKHADAGNKCEVCHDKIFQKKTGGTGQGKALAMSEMKEGKYCGACHNGDKTFDVKKNCKQCHVKP